MRRHRVENTGDFERSPPWATFVVLPFSSPVWHVKPSFKQHRIGGPPDDYRLRGYDHIATDRNGRLRFFPVPPFYADGIERRDVCTSATFSRITCENRAPVVASTKLCVLCRIPTAISVNPGCRGDDGANLRIGEYLVFSRCRPGWRRKLYSDERSPWQ